MKYLSNKIRAVKGLWYKNFFVVLDGRANSVTISKCLYLHIKKNDKKDLSLHVFKASDTKQYCFAFREDMEALRDAKTIFTELQYNSEHKKIGFRTDKPSVTGILSEYGISAEGMVKLSVLPRKTGNGETFYEIQKP